MATTISSNGTCRASWPRPSSAARRLPPRPEGQLLSALPLASYKLRFFEDHVRAVPAKDEAGCAFAGPGVDLRGDEARAILKLAGPFRAWLEAREPGVVLRSASADLVTHRVLITLEPMTPEQRPRVVRLDAPFGEELLASAKELEAALGEACAAKLRAR